MLRPLSLSESELAYIRLKGAVNAVISLHREAKAKEQAAIAALRADNGIQKALPWC